jgi:hypothetical protein
MHEAAVYVDMSYKCFAAHYAEWGIPSYKISNRVKFRISDLENFLESRRNLGIRPFALIQVVFVFQGEPE